MRKAIGALLILLLAAVVLPTVDFAVVGDSGATGLLELLDTLDPSEADVREDLYRRAQPDGKLLRVAGGSHRLPITHPDRLARQILEFSDRARPGGAPPGCSRPPDGPRCLPSYQTPRSSR